MVIKNNNVQTTEKQLYTVTTQLDPKCAVVVLLRKVGVATSIGRRVVLGIGWEVPLHRHGDHQPYDLRNVDYHLENTKCLNGNCNEMVSILSENATTVLSENVTSYCIVLRKRPTLILWFGGVPVYIQMTSPCKRPSPIFASQLQAPWAFTWYCRTSKAYSTRLACKCQRYWDSS